MQFYNANLAKFYEDVSVRTVCAVKIKTFLKGLKNENCKNANNSRAT